MQPGVVEKLRHMKNVILWAGARVRNLVNDLTEIEALLPTILAIVGAAMAAAPNGSNTQRILGVALAAGNAALIVVHKILAAWKAGESA